MNSCSLFQSLLVGMGPDPLDHMWWGDKNTGHTGIFDRADPANPFRKSNFVVFPHCGVDGHTADKESTYPPLKPVQQRGYANVTVALQRIVPTFHDATRIVVAGFSAGGIGCGRELPPDRGCFRDGPAAAAVPDRRRGTRASTSLRRTDGACLAARRLGPGQDHRDRGARGARTRATTSVMQTIAELHPGVRVSVVSSYADDIATPLYGLLNADRGVQRREVRAGSPRPFRVGSELSGRDSAERAARLLLSGRSPRCARDRSALANAGSDRVSGRPAQRRPRLGNRPAVNARPIGV